MINTNNAPYPCVLCDIRLMCWLQYVTSVHVPRMWVTAIQFHIIDVPVWEGKRISLQGAKHPRVSSAREVTVVLVYSELQTLRVHLDRQYRNNNIRVSNHRGFNQQIYNLSTTFQWGRAERLCTLVVVKLNVAPTL